MLIQDAATSLPHQDLVNCCSESIVQSRLLERFITVCGRNPDTKSDIYGPLVGYFFMLKILAISFFCIALQNEIFSKVQETSPQDRSCKIPRIIIQSNTRKSFGHDDHNLSSFELMPDFSILDVDKSTRSQKYPLYRQMASFVEVEGQASDSATPHLEAYQKKEIIKRCVDYASLIMTARPFNIFGIGIIIHGLKFSVMYIDRAGVCFSPQYDFEGQFKLFVCIVMRLTFYLSNYDLGQDPTVMITKGSYHLKRYPEFQVKMRDSERGMRVWTTYGSPLFVSRSVFGRGSSTWQAIDADGRHGVLKCTWKSGARIHTKPYIYSKIGSHPGIARWPEGDDMEANTIPLTTTVLRESGMEKLGYQLYRVAIQPIGKALWSSTTALEILLGFRSAIEGTVILHSGLCAPSYFGQRSPVYVRREGYSPPGYKPRKHIALR